MEQQASFSLGALDRTVQPRLKTWRDQHIASRIWKKDFTVWSPTGLPEISDRLGWLTLPETMEEDVGAIQAFSHEVRADRTRHVVLLGMGGSSLAPEVFQTTFGNRSGYPHLIVLDSTHPAYVSAVADRINLEETLFIVASKSGTTIEPISLFKYFYKRLIDTGLEPGRRFIAITDPGSPLETLATDRRFRRIFRGAADVGGRYSALSAFGLVPAALIGIDISDLLRRARSMADLCSPEVPEVDNPGLTLGAVLAELATAGRDKVTFITSRGLRALPDWLEQLIAESTGKNEKGIFPICGESLASGQTNLSDRFFVYIGLEGETDSEVEHYLSQVGGAGHPVARFLLRERADLGGEIFRWELAVAAAGAVLGIHPFNQPDVELAKVLARRAMSVEKTAQKHRDMTVCVESSEELAEAIKWLFRKARPGDYMAIQAYLAPTTTMRGNLQEIRDRIQDRSGLATTLGFGPRFLHSTGQIHKGGPNTGLFIQLIDRPEEDIPVPETDFTFGQLIAAQALGDYHALLQRDRRVARIDLGGDPASGLSLLSRSI